MGDERKELEDAVMDEFEWALQDPNSEKIRQLGEVVSIITTKLIEAIDELQGTVNQLQTQVSGMDSRINALKTSGVAVSAGASPAASAGAEPIPTMAKAPAAAPPAAPGGGGSMMGELKQLLAARRKKADG